MALERKDVDKKYKWDLSVIYKDEAAFFEDYAKAEKMVKAFAAHEKTMLSGAEGLYNLFMMEEIQLRQGYHGTGVFGRLYAWLIPLLPRDVRWVEAYAHISNKKSQGVLTHLGLSPVGDVSGTIRHFRGELASMAKKYAPQNETGIGS